MAALIHPGLLGPPVRALVVTFAAICLSLVVRPASATLISYAFDPGSEVTFFDGNVENISGNFTIDTTQTGIGFLSGFLVTPLGGVIFSGPPPESGTYGPGSYSTQTEILDLTVGGTVGTDIGLMFATELTIPGDSGLGPVSLLPPICGSEGAGPAFCWESSAGGVTLISVTVPEPSTVVLLIPALGLFLLMKGWTRQPLA